MITASSKSAGGWTYRKIKCPRHFVLKKGCDPFLREMDPALRKVSDWVAKKYKIQRYRIRRDRYGMPMRNPKSFYHPEISSAFAIEHVYDPLNPDCKIKCRGRCLEGHGFVNVRKIKRLSGGG